MLRSPSRRIRSTSGIEALVRRPCDAAARARVDFRAVARPALVGQLDRPAVGQPVGRIGARGRRAAQQAHRSCDQSQRRVVERAGQAQRDEQLVEAPRGVGLEEQVAQDLGDDLRAGIVGAQHQLGRRGDVLAVEAPPRGAQRAHGALGGTPDVDGLQPGDPARPLDLGGRRDQIALQPSERPGRVAGP